MLNVYLDTIAEQETRAIKRELAEKGFQHIATLLLISRNPEEYSVEKDDRNLFRGLPTLRKNHLENLIPDMDPRYRITWYQRRGDKTFKIYYGGQKNDK